MTTAARLTLLVILTTIAADAYNAWSVQRDLAWLDRQLKMDTQRLALLRKRS